LRQIKHANYLQKAYNVGHVFYMSGHIFTPTCRVALRKQAPSRRRQLLPATRRRRPEDFNFHQQCCENFKSCIT